MSESFATLRPPAPQRAFTLIEVLVALVIVALGMSALMTALTSSADSTRHLREKTFAQWVALNRIAELRLAGGASKFGRSEGTSEFAGQQWRWVQDVAASQVPGVARIEVSAQPLGAAGAQAAVPAKPDAPVEALATVTGVWGSAVLTPGIAVAQWDIRPPANKGHQGEDDRAKSEPLPEKNGDDEFGEDGDAPPPTDPRT